MQPPRQRVFEREGFWLWKRKDTPNWHIYWYPSGSGRVRRKSTGTSDLSEAKKRLIAHIAARRELRSDDPSVVRLLDVLGAYVQRAIEKSIVRWPGERTSFRRWKEFIEQEGLVHISDLTLDVQDRYELWRYERIRAGGYPGSTGTIQREFAVMRAALRSAWKRGLLSTVPYIRSAPTPPSRDRTLTVEECRALMRACEDPHLYRFVLFGLHTLQRPSAILDLRIEQVDLVRNQIDFLPRGQHQSNKRRPIVPISNAIRSELIESIEETNMGYIIEYGGSPIASVKRSFATAAQRAGIEGIYPYVLRHTGATLLAGAGIPLRQIAGMLGHSEHKTTEIYAKHRPGYLMDASEALADMLGDVT